MIYTAYLFWLGEWIQTRGGSKDGWRSVDGLANLIAGFDIGYTTSVFVD
jgi:hypothetical protein